MDCVEACVTENNQDRDSEMQYIRIHEIEDGKGFQFNEADDNYYHEVPNEGHFYMGTQCFHCEEAPCTKVCSLRDSWSTWPAHRRLTTSAREKQQRQQRQQLCMHARHAGHGVCGELGVP